MASRFWVGGTGTWDGVTTTHWATATGAAGGASVPGSADTVTFDGASGGGTVTVNTTITVQSIAMGAFTGTLDFSANNNNVTLSATSTNFNNSGSGTRTLNMGNGTWTLQCTSGNAWNSLTTTGLTFSANSSILVFTATTASMRTLQTAALTFSTVTINANSGGGAFAFATGTTIATLNVSSPNCLSFPGTTAPITNALNINGSSLSSLVSFISASPGSTATISSANNGTFTWAAFRDIVFTGGGTFTATNSIDLGHNSGITITAPSAGAGGLAPAPIVIGRGTPY